jgi:ribosomal-protein-alanine N-acetyltransferase
MYRFSPMTAAVADRIDGWSYPEPYDFYDLDSDPADRAAFLDPETWPDRTYAVHDADDASLVGFVSFTPEGDSVEVGLGMAPERTGEGAGTGFVTAAIAFAQGKFDPAELTLGVAAFNERAIRVYEAVGFERMGTYEQETNGGVHEFVGMRLAIEEDSEE